MSLINWIEEHMLLCSYKKYFNIECMGCGMQRSFISLLKGDVIESFQMYPALIPIIGMLLFLIIHIKFKFENGGTWIKYMFIFNLAVMAISYGLKFIT